MSKCILYTSQILSKIVCLGLSSKTFRSRIAYGNNHLSISLYCMHVYVNSGLFLCGIEDIVVNVYILPVVFIECLMFTKCKSILESQMCLTEGFTFF